MKVRLSFFAASLALIAASPAGLGPGLASGTVALAAERPRFEDSTVRRPVTQEKVLQIAAEQTGIFNTGGLGHTVSGLAKAMKKDGMDVEVLMPFYSDLPEAVRARVVDEGIEYDFLKGLPRDDKRVRFHVYSHTDPSSGVKTYLLKHVGESFDYFENKPPPGAAKRYTNFAREEEAFAMFNRAAANFVMRRRHTMINLHDWHTGLVRHYMSNMYIPSPNFEDKITLFTISNLGYQGNFDASIMPQVGIRDYAFNPDGFEFYGKVNFMKAGIQGSDATLTVSQGYLKEIQTPRFGHGLDGFLRKKHAESLLWAITNGADTEPWAPRNFTADDLSGKLEAKMALQKALGLPARAETPLVVMTSRLAHQKGYDYLPAALDRVASGPREVQLLIVGDGEPRYVDAVKALAAKHPARVKYMPFDAELEKRAMNAADFFLNTPWYEPSGTNQLFAMRAGAVPIVSRVGGLPDYVEDGKTGYLAEIMPTSDGMGIEIERTRDSVAATIERALAAYRDDPARHRAIARAAMLQDNTWEKRIPEYRKLFEFMRSKWPMPFPRVKECLLPQLQEMLKRP